MWFWVKYMPESLTESDKMSQNQAHFYNNTTITKSTVM